VLLLLRVREPIARAALSRRRPARVYCEE
jgi:hypothetical protein